MIIAGMILLLLLSTGLASILFLLARRDLSPRIAWEKAQNKFAKQPPAVLPCFRDAPYRRLRERPPEHHPTLINLQTSEGTGQACHPDVAYIAGGFGIRPWRYWMVCTPYAYANFVQENPELFASNDGIHWTIPEGVTNPLVPTPKAQWDHNSDPDMLFLHDKLWLYYRETRRTDGLLENRIYLTTSADGAQWSPAVEVLMASGDTALLLSPAVIHDESGFRMWTVEKTGSGLQLVRRSSADGVIWSDPVPCALAGLQEREPWHLDVIREKDRLSALLVSLKEPTDWRLHYAYSLDEGNSWNVEPFLLEPCYEFEEALQYRATMLKISSDPHQYRIWYSAANRRMMFSIAHQTMVREGSSLKPVPGLAAEDMAPSAVES